VYKIQGLLLHRTELAVPSSSGNPLVLCDVWSHQALPAAGPKFAVVYVHGGGMAVGNRVSAGPFSALLLNSACQLRTDVCVVTVEYILSTEKRFPGSLDDCLDVCRHLSARGVKVVLAGDSGGGGLVASTVLALRSEAQHSVIGAFLISPMLDQTHDRVYSARLSEFDIIQGRLANGTSRQYVESSVAAAHDVLASPVKCKDLRGLPPLLFHVGELEIFYDDAVEFHKNAVQSGVDCTLVAFPGMCHCFQLLAMDLPQAQESVKLFGDFCVKCWERSAAAEQLGSQPAAAWA
jgi:monoterpene epsilon-lactone hydrolase